MSSHSSPPADDGQRVAAVPPFMGEDGSPPPAADLPLSAPAAAAADLDAMETLGIRFDGSAYCFAGYRYSHLADALCDARRVHANGPSSEAWHWVFK